MPDGVDEWIDVYRMQGINTLPANTKEKFPNLTSYKQYHNEFVYGEQIDAWRKEGKFQNIFALLGNISNNTVEIDVDVPNASLEDIFKDTLEDAMTRLWIAESSNGKKKIYCRAKEVCKCDDTKVSETEYEDWDGKKKKPHVEYRGNGQGSILPPSVHPNGTTYKWLNLKSDGCLPELQTTDSYKLYCFIVQNLCNKFGYKVKEEVKASTPEKIRRSKPRFCFIKSHDAGDSWSGPDGHQCRVATVSELINCGYSDDEIRDFFKSHDTLSGETYSDEVTTKQLQYARTTRQHKWFCENLTKLKILAKYCEECSKNKKKEEIQFVSSFSLPDKKQLEEIIVDGSEKFILYDKNTDRHEIIEFYEHNGVMLRPFKISEDSRDSIVIPDGVQEYGTLHDLLNEMILFALKEYDPVDYKDLFELDIALFLTTWVSPEWQKHMAERFIPIINARGPSETGKKRFLTIARWLTYHSLYMLKTTKIPTLYRTMAPLKGTLVLDEADLDDSNLANELVEYLNSRCDGVPIPRYSSEEHETIWWASFGMTIMATRQGFTDDGLESRCQVIPTTTTDRPNDYSLLPPKEWLEKGKELQRKLLLFKLRHLDGVMPSQLIIPNISSFRVREALLVLQGFKDEDPTLMTKITTLAESLQERVIKERASCPEGVMLNSVYQRLTSSETTLEKHNDGYVIIEKRIIKKEDDTKEEITCPTQLKDIVYDIGKSYKNTIVGKMWRGVQQDFIEQFYIGKKRFRGTLVIKNLKRLENIFKKYIPNYSTPSCFVPIYREIKGTIPNDIRQIVNEMNNETSSCEDFENA